MSDKFFDQPVEQQVEVPEKIKLGEEEYSPEELQKLVGLGKIGLEAEEKYKTKIDRVWPEFTKKSQQISDYERRTQEYEQKIQDYETKLKNPATQPVSPALTEDIRRQALDQAEQLGIGPKAVENMVRQVIREENSARDLLGDINNILGGAEADGRPSATPTEILDYMTETGIRNPQIAYEQKFRSELNRMEVEKLSTLKRQGMVTTGQSTAGGKQPAPVRVTKDNLHQLVEEALNANAQGI